MDSKGRTATTVDIFRLRESEKDKVGMACCLMVMVVWLCVCVVFDFLVIRANMVHDVLLLVS